MVIIYLTKVYKFMITLKRIIYRMLDFYRRIWQAFLVASPAWVGIAYLFKDCHVAFIILLITAFICFVVALIGLYYDYRDARKKKKEEKGEADKIALAESARRMHPEYTEEQIKWFIEGK